MSTLVGLATAAISLTAWGSYFVPMKRVAKFDSFLFQLLMCIAIFVSSVLISFYKGTFVISYLGIISGALWATGNILSAQAVKSFGLSKAAPLWMGTGILVSTVWGLIFFKEKLSLLLLGFVGIGSLLLGIWLVASVSDKKQESNVAGIFLAIIAGLLFGTYLVPFKLTSIDPLSFLFPMSIGILTGGLLIFLVKRPNIERKIVLPGFASGLIWNVGNFASFFAVLNLGITIGFPLTQLALFVAVLWGLLYFKEIKGKGKIIKLIAGSTVLFLGAIFLTLSR